MCERLQSFHVINSLFALRFDSKGKKKTLKAIIVFACCRVDAVSGVVSPPLDDGKGGVCEVTREVKEGQFDDPPSPLSLFFAAYRACV